MVKPCIKCGAMDKYKRGDCKPCGKLAKANWYRANSEEVKLAAANWQKANPEKKKLANAKWYKSNAEEAKLVAAKWKESNSEKTRIANANWRKSNPGAIRIYSQNRRARERANGGKLSPSLAEILFKRQKGKCACCKEPLGKGYHLDHIMPITLGGKNEDSNIQLLRATCNRQKSAKHPIDYMRERGLLL